MARAESPSSAVPWMKRERAGGSGGGCTMSRHTVTLRWERCEHVHLRREPRGGQEKGTTVAKATTFIGRMKMGLWGKNQP